jgi:hypothetical protein
MNGERELADVGQYLLEAPILDVAQFADPGAHRA